ncbi:Gldg family protein [Lachnoclostridium sp. Marseille-P6806]|uniref:Gldg family protein n=1 Tax=Lachnoclostridium sp. Marseille-P6806 TaxID=2364793 RepID=UPI0013EF1BD1|nr:Gldg family protein [Lachnoclostridium sp. Marseille-P6806]
MISIYKREFISYFHSLIGWVFIALFWFIVSLFVAGYNLIGRKSGIVGAFSITEIILMILLPILTMRSFSDERRQKTDQLIYTAPVSIGRAVLGKYLAVSAVYTIPVIGFCAYPFLLSKFGQEPIAQDFSAIFGLWLYGLACIAICVFVSSLTESPMIAAVISFLLLLASYLVPMVSRMISVMGNAVTRVIGALDMISPFESLMSGRLSVTAVLYFLTVIALFLFLTVQVIQKRRYVVSRKTFSIGAYSSAMIAAAVISAVVLNLTAAQIPDSIGVRDVSANQLYALSDVTKEYLSRMDQDVTIYVLTNEGDGDKTLGETLSLMADYSSHLTVRYIDPAVNPDFVRQYTDSTELYANSLIVDNGTKSRIVGMDSIYEREENLMAGTATVTGYDGEGQIVSALSYVTSNRTPVIYVLTGHGELSLDDRFKGLLAKMNMRVSELDLIKESAVPDDAEAVLINCPRQDLSGDDAKKLMDYFDKGGNLIGVSCFESDPETPNWDSVLAYYGIRAEDGIVLDGSSDHYYSAECYLLPNVQYDELITKAILKGNGYVFTPYSQALTHDGRSDVTYTDLLKTSGKSCIRTDVTVDTQDFANDHPEQTQQYTIGLKAVKEAGEKTSTAVVFSSLMMFTSNADEVVAGSNSRLFTGTVAAVTGSDSPAAVSVPVKDLQNPSLVITRRTAVIVTVIAVGIIPVFLLAAGLFGWLRRRKR